jgi:hypothetical protein
MTLATVAPTLLWSRLGLRLLLFRAWLPAILAKTTTTVSWFLPPAFKLGLLLLPFPHHPLLLLLFFFKLPAVIFGLGISFTHLLLLLLPSFFKLAAVIFSLDVSFAHLLLLLPSVFKLAAVIFGLGISFAHLILLLTSVFKLAAVIIPLAHHPFLLLPSFFKTTHIISATVITIETPATATAIIGYVIALVAVTVKSFHPLGRIAVIVTVYPRPVNGHFVVPETCTAGSLCIPDAY